MEEGIHILGGGTLPVIDHPDKDMTFDIGGGWGDRIQIDEWPKKNNEGLASVIGWKNPKPKKGDKLRVPLESGKTMLCEFVDVRYCGNPADMFFADIKSLNYID